MINRRGLELIKQAHKPNHELVRDKRVPPIFRQYTKNYKLGPSAIKGELIRLNDNPDSTHGLSKITMYDNVKINGENYNAYLDYIFDFDQLKDELVKFENKHEKWNDLGFMQIGLIYHGDVLLIGMLDENRDEIWRYGQGLLKTVCSKLEEDIFQFIGKLKETIQEKDIKDWGITKEQIYRNLNENFWRIRRK